MFTPSFLHITNLYIIISLHTHQYLFMRALYIYIYFLSDIFISFPLSYISRYTPLRSRAIRRLVHTKSVCACVCFYWRPVIWVIHTFVLKKGPSQLHSIIIKEPGSMDICLVFKHEAAMQFVQIRCPDSDLTLCLCHCLAIDNKMTWFCLAFRHWQLGQLPGLVFKQNWQFIWKYVCWCD